MRITSLSQMRELLLPAVWAECSSEVEFDILVDYPMDTLIVKAYGKASKRLAERRFTMQELRGNQEFSFPAVLAELQQEVLAAS